MPNNFEHLTNEQLPVEREYLLAQREEHWEATTLSISAINNLIRQRALERVEENGNE